MEIVRECPQGLANILTEVQKMQVETIENGITFSVEVMKTDSPFIAVYIFDPKPRKGGKELCSYQFNSPCKWNDYTKESAREWKAMLQYYGKMKAKAVRMKK